MEVVLIVLFFGGKWVFWQERRDGIERVLEVGEC